jgi:PAS domain S-box-containing protein
MMRKPAILVVDDDRGLARLIEKLLNREGFSGHSVVSGLEAIAWCEVNRADLFLIDLKLPDFQANELIYRLGAPADPPPFIIITGQGDERVAVDMMKRGALDYLVKDSRFLDLLPIVVRRTLAHLEGSRLLSEAEGQLKREHAFSDAVLETSSALTLVMDSSGSIVRFNHACEIATGYSSGEVRGSVFWESALSDKSGAWWRNREDLLSGAFPRQLENYIVRKDGQHRLISWSLTTLVSDVPGGIDFVIASGVDITEQRRLESRILEIAEVERKRIGQDLHDGLCQLLGGIAMMDSVLRKRLAGSAPESIEVASDICHYTSDAIEQVRMVARGLSPVELETNGLTSALHELAATTRKLFGIHCDFICESPVYVPDNARATHLYRIVQESINNAVRHGHAGRIEIVLATGSGTAILSVTDDGEGFAPETGPGTGMGLTSMKYRTSILGGTLEISRVQPSGMLVRCTFPLEAHPLLEKIP